ncbi:hypothetical protein Patl1_24558 [Pistacia atlantica]|uniref:Uncharacterized protein n=1 Tax=Pistacia atlantica TaxID=434234 RepID=A0ACC0ZZ38_9ROSI|nr:hypothetical protein Patl1_24558 [Pistacia atlantica]
MGVHQLVLVLSQIILLFLPFKASAISCPSTCGNVSFWCPLGIGAGCYFEKGFEQPSHNQTDSTSAGCQSFCTCDPSQNATDCCDMIRTLPPNGKFNNTGSISYFYSKKIPKNCSSAFMVDQEWLQSNYLAEPSVLRGKENIPASLEWGQNNGQCLEIYHSGDTSCNADGYCLIKLSSGYTCLCDDQKSDRHRGCSDT